MFHWFRKKLFSAQDAEEKLKSAAYETKAPSEAFKAALHAKLLAKRRSMRQEKDPHGVSIFWKAMIPSIALALLIIVAIPLNRPYQELPPEASMQQDVIVEDKDGIRDDAKVSQPPQKKEPTISKPIPSVKPVITDNAADDGGSDVETPQQPQEESVEEATDYSEDEIAETPAAAGAEEVFYEGEGEGEAEAMEADVTPLTQTAPASITAPAEITFSIYKYYELNGAQTTVFATNDIVKIVLRPTINPDLTGAFEITDVLPAGFQLMINPAVTRAKVEGRKITFTINSSTQEVVYYARAVTKGKYIVERAQLRSTENPEQAVFSASFEIEIQ